jgi:hypothetical protein
MPWRPLASVPLAAVLVATACGGGDRGSIATFAGYWYGHDRGLRITRDGRARERVNSGCCLRVIDLELRLSQPRGTRVRGTFAVTVTAVRLHDTAGWPKTLPLPRVGQRRTLSARHGILRETLTGTTYCAPEGDGNCGA